MTDPIDLDQIRADAEAAGNNAWGVEQTKERNWIGPLRTDGSGKVRYIITHTDRHGLAKDALIANEVWATHIANMDPPTTIKILNDLERAEAALREIRSGIFTAGITGKYNANDVKAIDEIARAALAGEG